VGSLRLLAQRGYDESATRAAFSSAVPLTVIHGTVVDIDTDIEFTALV
jgi:hypothetical protein